MISIGRLAHAALPNSRIRQDRHAIGEEAIEIDLPEVETGDVEKVNWGVLFNSIDRLIFNPESLLVKCESWLEKISSNEWDEQLKTAEWVGKVFRGGDVFGEFEIGKP